MFWISPSYQLVHVERDSETMVTMPRACCLCKKKSYSNLYLSVLLRCYHRSSKIFKLTTIHTTVIYQILSLGDFCLVPTER